MIKAGVIGATGYAGLETVRLLTCHPFVTLSALGSVSYEGKRMSEVHPSLTGICDDILVSEDAVIANSDVVFASVPHGLSEAIAVKCKAKGAVLIDLGADFRLDSEAEYEKWYKGKFNEKALHTEAVYGLCELNRDAIKSAYIIGNPGCYPTGVTLALYPALKNGLIEKSGIICDCKSGVTGAGRGLTQNTHFPEANEAFAPYKAAAHRHLPEIEQTLSKMAGESVTAVFVPHLLPVNRGIISTIYAKKAGDTPHSEIRGIYEDFYKDEKFIRVLPQGTDANISQVRFSNYCNISLYEDAHTGTLIIASAIDNMVKGAAGNAVQSMNIRFGLPEDAGLRGVPPEI